MLLGCSFFSGSCAWQPCIILLPQVRGTSHPLLVTAFSVGICWPSGDFQGVCLISGLQSFQAQYAAGHPVRAQGLMHVAELVGAPLQSWNLGDKTLDKARKKRIGIEFIFVQDRQFLKLRSGDK